MIPEPLLLLQLMRNPLMQDSSDILGTARRKNEFFCTVHIPDNANDNIVLLRKQAMEKIKKINTDVANSTGLSKEEIDVAIFFGLIDNDQAYFWTEEWQRDYREAQRDIEEGNYETFENVDSLLAHLRH